ncbi:hypothetical protein [Lysobacter auxotrophicus]|uniref:Uncharacterized protein n=1 Tax=Lysobacter auxotrophicus TaxID=2992573 RepID=A0ABM8DFP6_9GAMM|nr:hypothetical protein [Lysobacter auxotrophicus]BDU17428.1 hypothetical protein LA521A_26290 [Lysobacter auxotrophicus]
MDERYSLMRGGLLYRLTHAGGAAWTERAHAPWIAFALLMVVLVPVVVFAAIDRRLLGGVGVPLLHDYTVWARFAIAMPALILAAPLADERMWRSLGHLRNLVQADDHANFERALTKLRRWRDSVWPELILFAIAIAGIFAAPTLPLYEQGATWRNDGTQLTPAGLWLSWVGFPVFRFLALLWLWRFVLWVCLLARFSRLDLALHAAHPDGCGGVGFLGYAHASFLVMPIVTGLLVAGSCAVEVEHLGVRLDSLRLVLGGYAVLVLAVMLAPLLLLTPKLAALKRNSLLAYGALGTDASEEFESRWLGRSRRDAAPILDGGDPSALADLTAVYATASRMGTVPVQRWILLQFIGATVLPLLPLLLLVMPLDQLVQKLFSMLV